MPSTSLKAEELHSAFELVAQTSTALDASYRELQDAVAAPARRERLIVIGEMTAKFAHEVRTPLASAMLYAAQLDRSSARQRRTVRKITARLQDLGRMVNDMLGFAAGTRARRQAVPVEALFREIRAALEPQLDESTTLQFAAAEPGLCIVANRDAIRGALLNLVSNAVQACGPGARIDVAAVREDDTVALHVTDNGPGIAPEVLPRIFDPFYTTRPQGTGLGLAVVNAVAAAHDGDVSARNTGSGARFTLRLPVDRPTAGAACDD